MSKTRILYVTQEMEPYNVVTEMAGLVRKLPQYMQEKGVEIRVLMPRFGTINERRHKLHEVVRLSGMNIIVDDEDYPLIIKVASVPSARMQVYFLDNEEFFKRKFVFSKDGKVFDDNTDRMVFFCKGAVEIVKKFGWAPNIVHCSGWLTSLVPLFLKKAYKNEVLFRESKIAYSYGGSEYESGVGPDLREKGIINNLKTEDFDPYYEGDTVNLDHGALFYSDALVLTKDVGADDEIVKYAESRELPTIKVEEAEDLKNSFFEFYTGLIEN